ncbi:transcriptional regulator, TetR family [Jatrophihabitans endophyticus]|uniref:Transcriptional regulator, TetR family n=1 Tax=Jatrophihabitans endophyticus TaxID=1206085 RepID=A0A1M5DCQ8_9ACTN|nr:transcriptional regulator, TetR family [Jatrophihabitans endophyticus]
MIGQRRPARIDELLDASMEAFAARGYFGTTTAQVARRMGVSQPYVIQTFGSKRELFLQTHRHAGALIVAAFRAVSGGEFSPSRLGAAYLELVLTRRAAVLVHAHAFSAASAEPLIGHEARRLFDEVYGAVTAAGASVAEAAAFLSRGMLINNLLLMDASQHLDEHDARPLVELILHLRSEHIPVYPPNQE